METLTRRDFAKAAATAAAIGLSATSRGASAQSKPATSTTTSPSDRIRLGFIGVGNRGDIVLRAFLAQPDAQVVAISDLYQPYLDHAAKKIGGEPTIYKDYRRLLDRKDIDAVIVATPDYWHAIPALHAIRAGKDVYLEKPVGHTVQ